MASCTNESSQISRSSSSSVVLAPSTKSESNTEEELDSGIGKMKASEEAACIICISSKLYTAQRTRFLAEFYLYHGSFLTSQHGKHQKCKQLIDNEDVALQYAQKICLQTAERRLGILGCKCKKYKKVMYFDGHEREDVVVYRRIFLDRMRTLERRMAIYEGEGMCDQLKLSSEEIRIHPEIPREAHCYIMPGKNQENYGTIDCLLDQIQNKVIPIFEAKFPNATAIFAFDNSTNHLAYAKDALIALRINLGPSRNQLVMRLTTYNDANGNQQFQSMTFEEDYKDPVMQRKPKRIKLILQKRRLWREELHLEYKICKNKELLNDHLRKTVPQVLNSVDLVTIRRFARKS
ncbi:2580_t:CDS:2 [Cetraspora pellucida]|uniref:2580_t:CDS:1 n=1 Tax=Cetraspora pellucida TaxID=1433469 RepID=A0A9N9DMZ2_9GLOM|nr:2580_t:CDS:2 [Cetraspora pellucida]